MNRNISDVLWEAISNHQVLSLYQGLGTKNLQSFISQFVYFYGYSFFKRLYLKQTGSKSIGTSANLVIAAAAGACTVIVTQASHDFLNFLNLTLNVACDNDFFMLIGVIGHDTMGILCVHTFLFWLHACFLPLS